MSIRKLVTYSLAAGLGFVLIVLATPVLIVIYLDYSSCNPRRLAQVKGVEWTANVTERTCFWSSAKTEVTLATGRRGVVFVSPPLLVAEGSHRIEVVWLGDRTLEVRVPRNGKIHARRERFEDVSIVYK